MMLRISWTFYLNNTRAYLHSSSLFTFIDKHVLLTLSKVEHKARNSPRFMVGILDGALSGFQTITKAT